MRDCLLILAVFFAFAGIVILERPRFKKRNQRQGEERLRLWKLADGDRHLQMLFGLREAEPKPIYTERDL